MKTLNNVTVLALLLTSGCVAETPETTATAASELGLKPDGKNGNHFYWAAYDDAPYIYKGCPDPGPEPWAERAMLVVAKGTREIDLELGTAVPLDVRGLDVPRGMRVMGNDHGAVLAVDSFVGDPTFTLLVNNERCSYTLEAGIWFE